MVGGGGYGLFLEPHNLLLHEVFVISRIIKIEVGLSAKDDSTSQKPNLINIEGFGGKRALQIFVDTERFFCHLKKRCQ